MKKILFLLYTLLIFFEVSAQSIYGIIKDTDNNPLDLVNVSVENKSNGVTSDIDGKYNIEIIPNRSNVILFSFIGYETEKIRVPILKKGQEYSLNIILKSSNIILDDIIVKDKKVEKTTLVE